MENYILKDLTGYGSFYPVCVSRLTAERLIFEWYGNIDDMPEFEDIWRIADINDMEKYGTED